jgi:DNA-binding NtrC family response regulator
MEEAGEAPSLRGRTVLLAEDEDMLRDVLALMLGDMELKVLPASNGNEAFRLLETYEGDIDFLLTDVVMPEMDGVRLGELFARARPDGNVIYMSGYPFLDGGPFSLPPRAQFLSKPLQEERVRKILERALQRRDERMGKEDGEE